MNLPGSGRDIRVQNLRHTKKNKTINTKHNKNNISKKTQKPQKKYNSNTAKTTRKHTCLNRNVRILLPKTWTNVPNAEPIENESFDTAEFR